MACDWLSVYIVVVTLMAAEFHVVIGFNVDTEHVVRYQGAKGSMFGFSVAEHRDRGTSWWVYAPQRPQFSFRLILFVSLNTRYTQQRWKWNICVFIWTESWLKRPVQREKGRTFYSYEIFRICRCVMFISGQQILKTHKCRDTDC